MSAVKKCCTHPLKDVKSKIVYILSIDIMYTECIRNSIYNIVYILSMQSVYIIVYIMHTLN